MTCEITSVRVRKITPKVSQAVAEVSYIIDDALILEGVRLVYNQSGYSLRMPGKFNKKHNRFLETFHPITRDFYEDLLDTAIYAYEDL